MANNPFNLATPQPVGTPFLANNGNPNTVYNTPATPTQTAAMHNAAAVGAALPQPTIPMASPFGATPVAANSGYAPPATQFWNNYTGQVRPVFDLSMSGVSNPNTGWTPVTPATPPPATGGTAPPPAGGGTGGNGMTSGGAGGPFGGGLFGGSGVTVVGTGFTDANTGATLQDGNGNRVSTRPLNSVMSGLNSVVDRATSGLGFNGRDGNFDVNQFLDAITQVILPGDLYNSNVGKWNTLNIAKAVLNSFVPKLGNLAEILVSKLPDGNPLKEWVRKNILQNSVDDAIENVMDAPQTTPSGGEGGGGSRPGSVIWGGGWGGGASGGRPEIVDLGDLEIVRPA